MVDLSDFKGGKIVGACMAGPSLTKNTELFVVATSTDSKVIRTFEKEGKNYLTEVIL